MLPVRPVRRARDRCASFQLRPVSLHLSVFIFSVSVFRSVHWVHTVFYQLSFTCTGCIWGQFLPTSPMPLSCLITATRAFPDSSFQLPTCTGCMLVNLLVSGCRHSLPLPGAVGVTGTFTRHHSQRLLSAVGFRLLKSEMWRSGRPACCTVSTCSARISDHAVRRGGFETQPALHLPPVCDHIQFWCFRRDSQQGAPSTHASR